MVIHNMDKGRIAFLIEQYLNDSATQQELDELENLLADPNADRVVKDALYASYDRISDAGANNLHLPDETKERIFQQIVMQPKQRVVPMRPLAVRLQRWLAIAAAALLIVSVGLFVWKGGEQSSQQEIAASQILPGTNRATLSLADGKTIALDDSQDGIIMGAGSITYNDGYSPVVGLDDDRPFSEMLVLSTPKGGTYSIVLPDGSQVWLNAASTLKYPSRFADDERVVHLEGEAYFSVTKRSEKGGIPADVPFKVVSNSQVVEVLGTEFNVSAYADESETQTTLVTGRVRVSTSNGARAEAKILEPGEHAINRQGAIHVQKADPDQYTAWKDGFFYFDKLPPQKAIAQLARWYDLEVIYQGKIPQVGIFGMIDRNKPLEPVLTALGKSGLNFNVVHSEGVNRLIVLGEQ